MQVALVVLVRFGDHFDLDVLKGEHAYYVSPAGHAAAEEILGDLNGRGHLAKVYKINP